MKAWCKKIDWVAVAVWGPIFAWGLWVWWMIAYNVYLMLRMQPGW